MDNIQNIKTIDFSTVSDQVNWVCGIGSSVVTTNGKLQLNASSITSTFKRTLGTVTPTNNRIGIKINLEAELSLYSSIPNAQFDFTIAKTNGEVLGTVNVYLEEILAGFTYSYFIDRFFKFDNPVGDIDLVVSIPIAWKNILRLVDLEVYDYKFNQNNIRSYFNLDDLFSAVIPNQNPGFITKSGIELKEWKVDGFETLTSQYFNENNVVVGNQVTTWKFAKSGLSGKNRTAETLQPISFNPFVAEFGLLFSALNYYSGKPTGTVSGSDYGTGISQIGIDKPIVLNGDLAEKKGAFFIDIDFTKSLKIKFDVIVNEFFSNIFSGPKFYREYTIEWDSPTCTKKFYYLDKLKNDNQQTDQLVNGFLSGLTPFAKKEIRNNTAFAEITWNDTFTNEDREGIELSQDIFFAGALFPVDFITWQKSVNGSTWNVLGNFVSTVNNLILTNGINQFRLRAMSNGQMIYSNVLSYLQQIKPIVGGISFPVRNSTMLNICISVISDGGADIIECGVVYNQTGNPTIADGKILYDNVTGNQCKNFTRPTPGAFYYFSSFATNSIGTTYKPYPNQL